MEDAPRWTLNVLNYEWNFRQILEQNRNQPWCLTRKALHKYNDSPDFAVQVSAIATRQHLILRYRFQLLQTWQQRPQYHCFNHQQVDTISLPYALDVFAVCKFPWFSSCEGTDPNQCVLLTACSCWLALGMQHWKPAIFHEPFLLMITDCGDRSPWRSFTLLWRKDKPSDSCKQSGKSNLMRNL